MRRTALLALTTILALAAAAPAGATLVVQRSLAGVKVGMTDARVRATLGPPKHVDYPRDEIQGSVKHLDYGLTDVFLSRGKTGGVQAITTASAKQRTSAGIGVGSTQVAVDKKVKGARCATIAGRRSCTVGSLTAGRTVTSFFIGSGGRVTRVSLGIVID